MNNQNVWKKCKDPQTPLYSAFSVSITGPFNCIGLATRKVSKNISRGLIPGFDQEIISTAVLLKRLCINQSHFNVKGLHYIGSFLISDSDQMKTERFKS